MLVITHSHGSRVIIGGGDSGIPEIVVVVMNTSDSRAVVGYDAPRSVPIHRERIHKRIVREEGSIRPGGSPPSIPEGVTRFNSKAINSKSKRPRNG